MKNQNSFTKLKKYKTSRTKNNMYNKFIRVKPNTNAKSPDQNNLMRNKTSTSISALNKNKSSTSSMTKPTCSLKETMSKLKSKMRFELQKYNSSIKEINVKIINDIIFDENKRIVSVFKDYLLWDETSDFFKKYYNLKYSNMILPKICRYYEIYTKFFPEYGPLEDILYILIKNTKRKKKYLQMIEDNEDKVKIEKSNKFKRLINDTEISLSHSNFLDTEMKNNIEAAKKKDMNNSTLKFESMEKDFEINENDGNIINYINEKNVSKDLYIIIQNCMDNNEKKYFNKKLKNAKKHKKNNLTESKKNKIVKNSKIIQSQNLNLDIIEIKNKNSKGISLNKIFNNKNKNIKKNAIEKSNNSNYTNNKSTRVNSCLEKYHNIFSQSINKIDNINKNSRFRTIRIYSGTKDKNYSPYNIKKLLYTNSENNSHLLLRNITNILPTIKYEVFRLNSYNNSRKCFAKNIINLKKDKLNFNEKNNKRTNSKTKTTSINKKGGDFKQKSCLLNLEPKKRKFMDGYSAKSKVVELDNDYLFINKIIEPIKNNNINKTKSHKNESKKIIASKFIKSKFKMTSQITPINNNIQFSPANNSNNLIKNRINKINPFTIRNTVTPRNNALQNNNINCKNLLIHKRKSFISSILTKKQSINIKGEIKSTSNTDINTFNNSKEKIYLNSNLKNQSHKKNVDIIYENKKYNLDNQIKSCKDNISKNLYNEIEKKPNKEFNKTQRVKNSIFVNEIQNHKKFNKYTDRNIKENNEVISDNDFYSLTSERKKPNDESKNKMYKEINTNKVGNEGYVIYSNKKKYIIKNKKKLKTLK